MPKSSLRILLADDETSLREPLAEHLKEVGNHQVDTATTGLDVFAKLEQNQGAYDIVLLDDLLVPEQSRQPQPLGVALTKKIKERYPHIEVIVFTGGDKKSALAAMQVGAYNYLGKPLDLAELELLMQMAAEHKRLQSEVQAKHILEQLMKTGPAFLHGQPLPEVLDAILIGVHACGFDRVRLYLLSKDKQFMVGHNQVGMSKNFTGFKLSVNNIHTRQLLANPKPYLFKKVEEIFVPFSADLEKEDVIEWAEIPLIAHDEVIGQLSIDNKFSQSPIQLSALNAISLFANQAAVAIENTHLYNAISIEHQTVELLNSQLVALHKVTQMIQEELNLTTLLNLISKLATELLEADGGGILLLDDRKQYLTFKGSYNLSEKMVTETSDKVGASIAGRVVEFGQAIIANNILADHRFHNPAAVGSNVKAILSTPLQVNGTIIGTLDVHSQHCCNFNEGDLQILAMLATQAATAIRNAQLYEEIERRGQLLEALDEASRHIRAATETDKLLYTIVQVAADLVGCEVGGLYTNHAHLKELELQVTYELPEVLHGHIAPHSEGLVGLVAQTGQSKIITKFSNWPYRDDIFEPYQLDTLIGVPLKQVGEVEAVLFVGSQTNGRLFSQADLEILDRFAAQAAIALRTSQLLSREERLFENLAILHRISNYIQTTKDLAKILHVVLTGITASYGLAFNRAAILLLDEAQSCLNGKMGIGYIDENDAYEDWVRFHQQGHDNFNNYLRDLEAETLSTTPVGEKINALQIPMQHSETDILSKVVQANQYRLVYERDFAQLPTEFLDALQPTSELIIVALRAQNRVIGILVADNKFNKIAITREAINTLLTFANTAAIAIDNTQLFQETQIARERLRSFYKASNTFISADNPDQLLKEIIEQTRISANAEGASFVLIDQVGQVQNLITVGTDKPIKNTDLVRSNGLSMRVMKTGFPEIINNAKTEQTRVNPSVFWRDIVAALCLPVSLKKHRIGVMWMHYSEPRHFSQAEIEAIQLIVNQVAVAYDTARRLKALEHLRQATEALSKVTNLKDVLVQIVTSAQKLVDADSAAIWSYDHIREKFILADSMSIGIPLNIWHKFHQFEAGPGQTAHTIMDKGWVEVKDIDDLQTYTFLESATRRLLQEVNTRSFQGIALVDGQENLGVLYINHQRLRNLTDEEWETVHTFANQAALALKKARLLDQVTKTRNIAKVVAEVTTLEDFEIALQSIVEGTQNALGCDAVTLYVYDQDKNKVHYPPIMSGVRYRKNTHVYSKMPENSFVLKALKQGGMRIVENTKEDEQFKNSRFTRQENITSCVVISLMVKQEKVGIMYVNYRTQHRFTSDEITNIKLFATQASVAIRNAQLFEQLQRRSATRQVLYDTGRVLASSLDLAETLDQIVEQVSLVIQYQERQISFACLRLIEGGISRIKAAHPKQKLKQIQEGCFNEVDLRNAQGARIGVMGRAALSGKSQRVGNVTLDKDYLNFNPMTKSELAVPIELNDQVIGVISAEHSEYDAFTAEDQSALELLAAQVALAIHNAQLYQQVTRNHNEVSTLQRVAILLTGTSELNSVLNLVMKEAISVTDSSQGNILFWDAQTETFNTSLRMTLDGNLYPYQSSVRKNGLTRKIIKTKKTIVIPDANQEKGMNAIFKKRGYRSTIGVPLLDQGKPVGVLYVRNTTPRSFTERQVRLLESLAHQATIAIIRAKQYEEMKEIKGYVGSRTAFEWIEMVSKTWAHDIYREVGTTRAQIAVTRELLSKSTLAVELTSELDNLDKKVKAIQEIPITDPLSYDAAISRLSINKTIQIFFERRWRHYRYQSVKLTPHLQADLDELMVAWVSEAWLRRGIELVLDNAVSAMENNKACRKEIIVTTTLTEANLICISIRDTGPGIPKSILKKLFKKPIEKSEGSGGSGVGLILAQTIFQTYKGDIAVTATSRHGTEITISLPGESVVLNSV